MKEYDDPSIVCADLLEAHDDWLDCVLNTNKKQNKRTPIMTS